MSDTLTLVENIALWHKNGDHSKIVRTVLALPDDERTNELIGFMARAYNNLSQYALAEQYLLSIPEEDRGAAWHYRLSYAYFYSHREEEARTEIQRALEIEPDDQFSLDFAAYIDRVALSKGGKQTFAYAEDGSMNTIRESRPKRRM